MWSITLAGEVKLTISRNCRSESSSSFGYGSPCAQASFKEDNQSQRDGYLGIFRHLTTYHSRFGSSAVCRVTGQWCAPIGGPDLHESKELGPGSGGMRCQDAALRDEAAFVHQSHTKRCHRTPICVTSHLYRRLLRAPGFEPQTRCPSSSATRITARL
jgi:hypothetical protein